MHPWSKRLAAVLSILIGSAATAEPDRSWEHYGGTPSGLRHSPHGQIRPDNLDRLSEAWRYRTGDAVADRPPGKRTSFKATPVYLDGRLYVVTAFYRVHAIDPGSGQRLWVFDPQVDLKTSYSEMYTARGLTGWRDSRGSSDPCARRLFLGTIDARLIALDAKTGQACADFGEDGEVDLSQGIRNFRPREYGVTSPPAVIGDVVVVGSSVGDNGAVDLDHGVVRGFDARSGKQLWRFDPVPRSEGDPGFSDWSAEGRRLTGAANVWSTMSGDAELGLVFLPTTSPSPDFYGGRRPGSNRYANSLVALDVETGAFRWGFQTVHHDLWDYDLASQPSVVRNGESTEIWLPTKMGFLFAFDARSGEPVIPVTERPAPASDVAGESAWPTQPWPRELDSLHPRTLGVSDAWGRDEAELAHCRGEIARYRFDGLFTPPNVAGTVLYPGNFGGTNWGSASVDRGRGLLVLPMNRVATVVALVPREAFERRAAKAPDGVQFTAQEGTPFGMMRFPLIHPDSRLPCIKGPWGTLIAVDMASRTVRWEMPIGHESAAEDGEARNWGSLLAGGPMTTAGGLTFIGTRNQGELLLLETTTGRVLRRLALPAGAHATPMSYRHDGRQYVAIAAGGKQADGGGPGDFLIAFALDAR